MAAASHLEYLVQVEKNPLAFCGKRIIATVLMKTKQKKRKCDKVTVLGLGTGIYISHENC